MSEEAEDLKQQIIDLKAQIRELEAENNSLQCELDDAGEWFDAQQELAEMKRGVDRRILGLLKAIEEHHGHESGDEPLGVRRILEEADRLSNWQGA